VPAAAVRLASHDDLDALLGLWREMMELHREIEPRVWSVDAAADEHFRRYMSDRIGDEDFRVFVAVRQGEVVGYLLAVKAKRPPVLSPPVEGVIQDCCVTRSARREGIGKLLVAEALAWFRAEGLSLVRVSHALGNEAGSAFWEAQGFRPYMVSCVWEDGGGLRS